LKKSSTGAKLRVSSSKRQRICCHAAGEPSKRPSGVATSQSRVSVVETSVAACSPVLVSHTRVPPSSLPVESHTPSGLNATPLTASV
jgi:hypothetical protein